MLRTSLALALPLLVIAVAEAGGCGGSGSTGGTDMSGCEDYFDGLLHCAPPVDLPDALDRFRSRFDQFCARKIALPGTSFTGAQASACGKALKALACDAAMNPAACDVKPGALADGAPCNDSSQCKSAACVITIGAPTDGGASSPACGACTAAIPAGQPCGAAGMIACAQGTVCDGSGGNLTCTPITYGGAGAVCGSAARCNGGLFCDSATKMCTAQKAAGAACMSSQECGSGLTCDQTSMTCAKLTVVSAGQPCSAGTDCEIGSCPATGKCPTVLADGQPCDPSDVSTACDIFAKCEAGSCQAFLSDVCK